MCSIFGAFSARAIDPIAFASVQAKLNHRGPDDKGLQSYKLDDNQFLYLGHTRLSILDLSPAGHQPMVSPDGRYAMVYNGEVYNYQELRRELSQLGYVFSSHTDTEVVLYAWVQWGKAALTRFKGMFAFAVFDQHQQRLTCIRDHFGIKPFFYWAGKTAFYFASEIPALLQFPGVKRTLNWQRAYDYLLRGDYDSSSQTMLSSVQQLEPGHLLALDLRSGEIENVERYWQLATATTWQGSYTSAVDEVRQRFLDNVRLHLRSDVPLGAALSGGIDSSSIVCAIKYLEPDISLDTFSYVATGSPVSEEHWVNIVNQYSDNRAHKVQVASNELLTDLDTLIDAQGEPFGSTSIYAQYRVFRLAKERGIKVILEGQGADELLAGYQGYPLQRLKTLVVHKRYMAAAQFLWNTSQWPGRSLQSIVLPVLKRFLPDVLKKQVQALIGLTEYPDWLRAEVLKAADVMPAPPQQHRVNAGLERCFVKETLARLLCCQGLAALLRHGDRNAMQFSIENRVPFLTHDFAAFLLSLPEHYLIDERGRTKAVFKDAMCGIVPDTILTRRDKIGFETPELQWLKTHEHWVQETLAEAHAVPFLSVTGLQKEWCGIKHGNKSFDFRMWRSLNLIRWLHLFNVR